MSPTTDFPAHPRSLHAAARLAARALLAFATASLGCSSSPGGDAAGATEPGAASVTLSTGGRGLPPTEDATIAPPRGRAELRLRLVDDGIDPLSGATLPSGGTLLEERAQLGPGPEGLVHFVRIVPAAGESLPACLARARAWAATVSLPEGAELVFGPWEERTERGAVEAVAVRSYVLTGAAFVTEDDVREAELVAGGSDGLPPSVAVVLRPEGGARLAEATRRWLRRRIAIVVDGEVASAPLVVSEITGGRLQISLGGGAAQEGSARRLADALRPAAP